MAKDDQATATTVGVGVSVGPWPRLQIPWVLLVTDANNTTLLYSRDASYVACWTQHNTKRNATQRNAAQNLAISAPLPMLILRFIRRPNSGPRTLFRIVLHPNFNHTIHPCTHINTTNGSLLLLLLCPNDK